MAGVSTPELAVAVSNAGALGSIGIGASSISQARQMIEATRAQTTKPFNVNVFCHPVARQDAEREAAWLAHLAPLFREFGADVPDTVDEIYRSYLADEETFRAGPGENRAPRGTCEIVAGAAFEEALVRTYLALIEPAMKEVKTRWIVSAS